MVELVLVGAALALVVVAGHRRGETILGERAGAYSSPRPLPSGGALRDATVTQVEPAGCGVPDRGMGDYVETERVGVARVYVRKPAVADSGDFTLLVHFHGGEPVRRILADAQLPVVIATVDRGIGSSAYAHALDAASLAALERDVAARVRGVVGFDTRVARLYLSSWSAGYKAIEGLLANATTSHLPAGVVLLDSLHASFDGPDRSLRPETVAPFVDAARRAADDDGLSFAMLHTEIHTADYASTTETADVVLGAIGVVAERVDPGQEAFGVTRIAGKGGFVLRGHRGGNEDAHCNALYALPDLLRRGLGARRAATSLAAPDASTSATAVSP